MADKPTATTQRRPDPEWARALADSIEREVRECYDADRKPGDTHALNMTHQGLLDLANALRFASSAEAGKSDLVQTVLKAISAIPADNVDDIEKAVATMNKVSVAAYFHGRGINQAESAFLEAVESLRSATARTPWDCPHAECAYPQTCRDAGKCAAR